MNKTFCVYIATNRRNGALYVGVTSDLPRRMWQHKHKTVDGFTAKHGVNKLVYYESCESAESAIRREKQLKKWSRRWKLRIIEEMNPDWRDLYDDIV